MVTFAHAACRRDAKLGSAMATPIMWFACLASLTLTTAPLLLLFWLMQPVNRANPGVSAYHPPHGARVLPIAQTVGLSDRASEFPISTNFAREHARSGSVEQTQQNEITKASPKREVRLAYRKRSQVGRRKDGQPAQALAQEWNNPWQSRYR